MDKELLSVLNTIIEKLDEHSKRFDAQDKRFDAQDKKFDEQGRDIRDIIGGMAKMEKRLDGLADKVDDLTGIVINMENNMNKRIESLFDGYKLAHEKQWELDRRMEELERRLAAVEARTA